MKTKEKILAVSQRLFNEEGVDLVTPRRIALEAGLSHGNLRYHFPKKEDILYALYLQLVSDFDQVISDLTEDNTLEMAFEMMKVVYAQLYAHRYLMADFVSIMRQVEPIRTHYQTLFFRRKGQFLQILQALRQEGILREELTPGQDERLVWQLNIFSDFWIGAAEIHFQAEESERISFFVEIGFSLIYPYLTEKGIARYNRILGKSH